MWERFSFYGMRALLTFYLIKGFLRYDDSVAYTIYGAYTALIYMMPFFGGMLADRLLGARKAVVIGGLLMATGSACLVFANTIFFYTGLGISHHRERFLQAEHWQYRRNAVPPISREAGWRFHDFLHGNQSWGGHGRCFAATSARTSVGPGVWLATIGMLVGLAVFVVRPRIAQIVIGLGAIATVGGLIWFHPTELISTLANLFVAFSLLVSATVAILAIGRGGLPVEAVAPPDPVRLKKRLAGILPWNGPSILGH